MNVIKSQNAIVLPKPFFDIRLRRLGTLRALNADGLYSTYMSQIVTLKTKSGTCNYVKFLNNPVCL